MRIDCGGYTVRGKSKLPASSSSLQPLAPKAPMSTTHGTTLISLPIQQSFQNDQELQYFQVYCDSTATGLGEYLDVHLWSRIVLQASAQEPYIRNALIALGALNKTLSLKTLTETQPETVKTQLTVHYQAAFQNYGKLLKGIRKACEEERVSRRTILIACLLAICFEYLDGNASLAIAHIKSGILLSKLPSLDEKFYVKIATQPNLPDDRIERIPGSIETHLLG
jgi:hypothetical protein